MRRRRAAGDDETLDAARRDRAAEPPSRHGADGGARFLLFHRRRLWNASERAWMGWERKRGKLHELNRLCEARPTPASCPRAPSAPSGVRYVITLDADTRLPRGAVERLVGTMAHPLNRPRFDPGQRRVVEGYAVLQPRVTPPLPGREGSWFQRLSSGPAGIDPYAAAVSDVYQDLWGRARTPARGSTTSTRSRRRWPDGCPRTRC
jgi:cyclic beta-1,2-glucan synthetase